MTQEAMRLEFERFYDDWIVRNKTSDIEACMFAAFSFGRAQGAAPTGEALAMRELCASIAEEMRPAGGRAWTLEQKACYEALTACAENIRAITEAAPSNAEGPKPDGWVLVPALPTYQMCEAAGLKWETAGGDGFPFAYLRMLKAVPAPPSSSQEGAGIEDQHDRIMGPRGRFR